MKFRNPMNGYVEEVSGAVWLWVLLFGTLYFAVRGVWTHALISFVLAVITGGISWILYPLFAKEIMRKHYLSRGWSELPG